MLQSDQFCRLTKTSVRRRATWLSNFEGMPYIAAGIGRPISCDDGGIVSGAARATDVPTAPVASAVPAMAAPWRRKCRRS